MTDKLDLRATALLSRLIRKIMAMDRSEKMCYGVTLSQWYVIDTVWRRNGITMNELSQELGLAMSTLTRVIDVLVRDDVLTRCQSAEDRRRVCLQLTKKGDELAGKLKACTEEFWSKILGSIPAATKKEIVENLKILLDALDAAESSCCPKT